jgi:hypothetical protein
MSILKVTIVRDGATNASAKVRRDALRDAYAYIGRMWDKLFKMKRFTDGATSRYHLKPRSGEPGSGRRYKGSYTEAKVKRKKNGDGRRAIGESKPFVWAGDSREKVRNTHKVVAAAASASRGYAENIFDVPTLNLTPKGGTIKPREEFQTVIEEERSLLEALGAGVYENKISQIPPSTKTFAA